MLELLLLYQKSYLIFEKRKKAYKREFCLTFVRMRGILHLAKVKNLTLLKLKRD